MRYVSLIICSLFYLTANSQIISGPMLGYNTMTEVLIWVQTKEPSTLVLTFDSTNTFENPTKLTISTSAEKGNTAHFTLKNLTPGTTYFYQLREENDKAAVKSATFTTQQLWQHRTDPPNFTFATGSCAYTNDEKADRPGKPYGQHYKVYAEIVKKEPRFMLWLGDNIYLRETDWHSKSGIYHRYTDFKSLPEVQPLWKSMHHYAIWDDHDFGPNDADRSFVNKEITLQAFKDFWGNYDYGINGKAGITNQFSFNDVDFFLLDNRYYRSPNERKTGKQEILGEEQIQWLIDALVNSNASFKVVAVGGQFLSPAAVYENHATFNEERERLIELITKENLKNVIFFSGDRHKTELTKMTLANGNDIYDYTCSPLTSKAYNTSDEGNDLRVKGTHVSTQNFGTIELSGPLKQRSFTINTFDSEGKLLWTEKISQQ